MLKVDCDTGKVSAPYGFVGNVTGNCSGSAGSVAWSNVSGKPSIVTTDTTQSISGAKTFSDIRVNNIPQDTSMPYFLGIEAFADGGRIKWVGKDDAKVGYATSAGSASSATKATQDSDGNTIKSTYAKLGAHNNLTASDNEFTFASSGFSGDIYLNYRTAGGTNGNITGYILGNGKGGTLGTIIHSGNISNYISGGGSSNTTSDFF
jgi:hypothetical protein